MPDESPNPNDETTTSREEAAPKKTRRTSRGSSARSSAATSAFIADPGPAFEPADEPDEDVAAAELGQPEPAVDLLLAWEEPQVRALLEAQGSILHTAIAVDKESDEWLYSRNDLSAIAPPLTRILNRYDATRAAAGTADELGLMIGLAGYVTRSIRTRRAAYAELGLDEPRPVSGVAADPGTGPEDDVNFSATVGATAPAPPITEEDQPWAT